MRRRTAGGVSALTVVVCGICATGCGGAERSPEAYCRAFYTKAAPLREGYVEAGKTVDSDPLNTFVKLLSAPGDLASVFDGMVPHAPDDIRSDTVIVRDSFKKLQDSMGEAVTNPLGAIARNLGTSLSSAGAFDRVDAYLGQHCPVNSPLAQEIIHGQGS